MNFASTMQKFQDWVTQQWVILSGRKFDPSTHEWLLGPFGEINSLGQDFIQQLAAKENLTVEINQNNSGLISSIDALGIDSIKLQKLPKEIIDFYERTSHYQLNLSVKWNSYFRFFGWIVNRLFSNRIDQLNIPTTNSKEVEPMTNEIIQLRDPDSREVRYTIWLRRLVKSNRVIYSGAYQTCCLPSGIVCIKAVFPLPKGNATVLIKTSISKNNELILDSSGKQFGDAGFYFLLNDSRGNFWAKFVSSFTDQLIVSQVAGNLRAKQTLKLWNMTVVNFDYDIEKVGRFQ